MVLSTTVVHLKLSYGDGNGVWAGELPERLSQFAPDVTAFVFIFSIVDSANIVAVAIFLARILAFIDTGTRVVTPTTPIKSIAMARDISISVKALFFNIVTL